MKRASERYPYLGKAVAVPSFEHALQCVRSRWTGASAEGSSGPERTFYAAYEGSSVLVGHYWHGTRRTMKLRMWTGSLADAASLDPGR